MTHLFSLLPLPLSLRLITIKQERRKQNKLVTFHLRRRCLAKTHLPHQVTQFTSKIHSLLQEQQHHHHHLCLTIAIFLITVISVWLAIVRQRHVEWSATLFTSWSLRSMTMLCESLLEQVGIVSSCRPTCMPLITFLTTYTKNWLSVLVHDKTVQRWPLYSHKPN